MGGFHQNCGVETPGFSYGEEMPPLLSTVDVSHRNCYTVSHEAETSVQV